jgi:tetratricopeptide (TPR) repeat protein
LYALREVEQLLRLPRSTIRSLIRAGCVTPARGPRGALQFSFQDLVVLRKAQALVAAKVPQRHIVRAMLDLRRKAESGQYSLALEGMVEAQPLRAARKAEPLDDLINRGYALHEAGQLLAAEAVYGQALVAHGNDPLLLYNLGVLLEDLGRSKEALASYESALDSDPGFADCHYNLALLCKGLGRPKEAIRHLAQYRRLTRRPK